MFHITRTLTALVVGLSLSWGVVAQTAPASARTASLAAQTDLSFRVKQSHQSHVIQSDGKAVSTFRVARQVLKPQAIEALKTFSMSVSRSAQSLEILEAYTQKPQGRRLPVPRSSWQVQHNTGAQGQAPVFSDETTITLLFPEVTVGDTVVVSYRISTKDPLFPGKLSLASEFSPELAWDDVKVTVDAPAQMPINTRSTAFTESQTVKGTRRIIQWSWRNTQPVAPRPEDGGLIAPESLPGYAVSSFTDWSDIARNYVNRAYPKAAVTPAIQKLSDELTQGASTVRERAQALHHWVARNITYGGNCVGIGAVVPRDLDSVLKHRMGDCKDHATLLQALLKAQQIESHQALVNAGSVYGLGTVPVAQRVNHVITYIPALQQFVDSTDSDTSFGLLPLQLYGKPVLSASAEVPTHIPAMPDVNRQRMHTNLKLLEDGGVEGEVTLELRGHFALHARQRLRGITDTQRREFVRQVFLQSKLQAEGELSLDDPEPLSDEFQLSAKFKVAKAINFPGTGALAIAPWFYNEAPVFRWGMQANLPVSDLPTVCAPGQTEETYVMQLPATMQVVAQPEDQGISSAWLSYDATYRLEDRVLTVKRQLRDTTPGPLCQPEESRSFQAAAAVVLQDVRQQLMFKGSSKR